MNDTSEDIRHQMDETKTHLSEKLESLEQQVSETVQSTGTAVNATVEAVQETVETVTGAVQGAVQSVSNAFDIRRQIDRHPLLVLGGAAVLGYLASESLRGRAKKPMPLPLGTLPTSPSADSAGDGNGTQSVESAAVAAAIAAAYKSGWENSFSYQLKGQALVGLMGVVQEVASRAVPLVMDYLTGNQASGTPAASTGTDESQGSASQPETAEAAQHLHIASTENSRFTKSS